MIADRYMVVTSLGEGGMADVYLAIDTILNREVAVKVLRGELSQDPVALLRFLREASAVSKLHHPNVVEVYDVGEYDSKNYIVMEYIRGRTLKQLIAQRGALTKEEAVEIMMQLVSAVNHAHEKNIIHRDIKPQNVLVKDDGTVKITDFGIALAHDNVQLTQSDSVLGSAHYIAPETTRGEVATVQIDIYALGIVFYELLTGSVPFKGDNPVQIAMKHLREEIPSIRDFNPTIPQSIDNIIVKATAKNRLQRYVLAKDMLFDLEMCLLPEFANVEKIHLDDKEENGETLVLDTVSDLQQDGSTLEVDAKSIPKGKTSKGNEPKKEEKTLSLKKVMLIFGVLLVLAGGTVGVYYSGLIPSFSSVKLIEVPSLEDLTKEKAREKLEEIGLELGDVKYEVTDDVKKGLIFKQSVSKGKEVKEGSSIDVSISSGKYFVVEDYTGLTIEVAKSQLPDYIKVYTEYREDSDAIAGTILSQELLNPGDKVKPNVSKQIRFIIAVAPEFTMPDFTGSKIETAKTTLEKLGVKVVLSKREIPNQDDVPEEDRKEYQTGVVVEQTPTPGSVYRQEGSNVVTLYYYE